MRRLWSIPIAVAAIVLLAWCGDGGRESTPTPTPSPCPPGEIYRSANLDGHAVDAECNPGGAQSCPCTRDDVALKVLPTHAEVTSNPRGNQTWVNAIGYKKFTSQLPDGCANLVARFRYSGRFRLPVVPRQNVNQEQNPDAAHAMIQYWDATTKNTIEGTIFLDLNPWRTCDTADGTMAVRIYETSSSSSLALWDTGLRLPCDTTWHTFKLEVDLVTRQYLSIAIDAQSRDLTAHQLAQVHQSTWTGESFLSLTTESEAAWPQSDCRNVFWWTTEFADVVLERL